MKNSAFLIVLIFFFKLNLAAQTKTKDNNNEYPNASVSASMSTSLNPVLAETSGLIEWDGYLYTHNDDSDTNLYKLDKSTGEIVQTISLPNISNIDWEEISQDENYLYIGDIGNNVSGNRTDLKIYKIAKTSLSTTPQIETINFSYSNQTDLNTKPANKTDFDCEVFIVSSDGIFLFTKQWLSKKTSVYQLPKNPGTYVANLLTTLDISGLITGATFKEDLNLIALCGYNSMLSPFIYLIYDFKETDFAVSNKQKIKVSLPFHQIEGIATSDGLGYFLTNEKFKRSPFLNNPQKLHKIELNPYLEKYVTKH